MHSDTILFAPSTQTFSSTVPDSPHTVIVLFAARDASKTSSIIRSIRASHPQSLLIGASTAGQICGGKIVDDDFAIATIGLEKSRAKLATFISKGPDDVEGAGRALAQQLKGEDLKAVLVLCDGLVIPSSALLSDLRFALGDSVVITGGLAADGSRFEKTWVIANDQPQERAVTAIGFYGKDFHVQHSSRGGWNIFGPERVITRSEGNVLYTIDDKPALDLYKTYLGDKAKDLPGSALLFPLQIRKHSGDIPIVRTVLAVDHKANTMTFAGDVPMGHKAQLMRANFDNLINAAREAGQSIMTGAQAPLPQLCIAISCVGRRMVLGIRTEEEVQESLNALPNGCKQVGFYSYGEISPLVPGNACELLNQTMTLTTYGES